MKDNVRAATAVDGFVGAQLKNLRKSAKLSQTGLAEKVGVTFQQIQKYEHGTNRIGASRLWEFCKIFDVSPNTFFTGLEAHLLTIRQMAFESQASRPSAQQYSLNDIEMPDQRTGLR